MAFWRNQSVSFGDATPSCHRSNSCERRGSKPFVVVPAGSMQEKMARGLMFVKTCKNGQLISIVRLKPLDLVSSFLKV